MPSFFPLDVLDEIWDLIESVSEGFLTYFRTTAETEDEVLDQSNSLSPPPGTLLLTVRGRHFYCGTSIWHVVITECIWFPDIWLPEYRLFIMLPI